MPVAQGMPQARSVLCQDTIMPTPLYILATDENFDEDGYLAANPDVAEAHRKGLVRNLRHHFEKFGRREGRRIRIEASFAELRDEKIRRIEPLLKRDMPHTRRGAKYDFLTADLRASAGVVDTANISSHEYDDVVLRLIEDHKSGTILDCGAGRRPTYHANVVNFDIVDFDTTDILGVGEQLPFQDHAFDAVISIAVLEHVRDPAACAAEIVRVLKPGGKLVCCVPFLQPLHGFPRHYYNMTSQGLRALFESTMQIDEQFVSDSGLPIWSLTWILESWARGLSGRAREQFLSMPVRDFLESPAALLDRSWVRQLSKEKNFELASATMLIAHKPRA